MKSNATPPPAVHICLGELCNFAAVILNPPADRKAFTRHPKCLEEELTSPKYDYNDMNVK